MKPTIHETPTTHPIVSLHKGKDGHSYATDEGNLHYRYCDTENQWLSVTDEVFNKETK